MSAPAPYTRAGALRGFDFDFDRPDGDHHDYDHHDDDLLIGGGAL